MATLLLSTVGKVVGGPVGALVGAVAGRFIDGQVLGLGNRRVESPRQENLGVQSGSYGGTIPLLFGTGRYAGNVIWSSGLVETREEERQGGKGGPSVTSVRYAYSASFAVGICLGPIQSIGRIWADGKLIRSAGEALSVGGDLRVYTGSQDQLPDPFMEGEIGLDAAPGFRGLAYCVFEALPLGEFANRIPNFTFEVIESDSPDIADIAGELVSGAQINARNTISSAQAIGGYHVSGTQSYRDGLSVLTQLFPLKIVADETGLILSETSAQIDMALPKDDLGARPALEPRGGRLSMEFDHSLDLPAEVNIAFEDPATDYQRGVQNALKLKNGGTGAVSINTAMTLSAAQARALAVQTLSNFWAQRRSLTIDVGLRGSVLEPGDIISLDLPALANERFEITQTSQSSMVTRISARALAPPRAVGAISLPSYSGEVFYTQTIAAPQIQTTAFELPATAQFGAEPAIYAAIARTGGRINSAGLYASRDGGVNYDLLAQVPVAAVTGICLNGLEDRNPALMDDGSVLDVQLDHGDMALASRPLLAILNGANLARVGGEYLQFQNAELLESGAYRLTGLLRARTGKIADQMGSAAGQSFVLLRNGDLASQDILISDLGTSVLFKVVPSGQVLADAPPQSISFTGQALLPLSPVHISARYDAATGVQMSWVRRSRTGFGWLDGADAPIGEAALSFQITYRVGAVTISRDVASEGDVLSVADISANFGAGPHMLAIAIAQISDAVGPGAAASATLALP